MKINDVKPLDEGFMDALKGIGKGMVSGVLPSQSWQAQDKQANQDKMEAIKKVSMTFAEQLKKDIDAAISSGEITQPAAPVAQPVQTTAPSPAASTPQQAPSPAASARLRTIRPAPRNPRGQPIRGFREDIFNDYTELNVIIESLLNEANATSVSEFVKEYMNAYLKNYLSGIDQATKDKISALCDKMDSFYDANLRFIPAKDQEFYSTARALFVISMQQKYSNDRETQPPSSAFPAGTDEVWKPSASSKFYWKFDGSQWLGYNQTDVTPNASNQKLGNIVPGSTPTETVNKSKFSTYELLNKIYASYIGSSPTI